jgi:two-component system chemotaxis sensor kinase CheA
MPAKKTSNSDKKIVELIEKLSGAIVLIEVTDLRKLADIHTCFEEIGKWASSKKKQDIATASVCTANLIEKIILAEVSDPLASLEIVERVISCLQTLICEKRSPDQVKFPEELHQYESDSGSVKTDDVPAQAEPAVIETSCESQPEQKKAKDPAETPSAKSLPPDCDLGLLNDFINEALEHLENSDLHLLTLETDPKSGEALNAVFRAFHTIKGVAGFLSLEDIQKLAHQSENLLDKAREGKIIMVGPAVDISFESVDCLKTMINNLKVAIQTGINPAAPEVFCSIIERTQAIASGTYIEAAPEDADTSMNGKKLGEILVQNGKIDQGAVYETLAAQHFSGGQEKLGELLVKTGKVPAKDVASALRIQKAQPDQTATAVVKEPAKVDAEKLDRLIETIGELVIVETMVTQSDELIGCSTHLGRQLSQLSKITRELQEMGTSLRMVPIRATFQKMARMVRDLAKKAGKQVELYMSGEDTELDKTIVDKISDPLVHMIRNAVDHGIESPEERRAVGKPEIGKVDLKAFHRGGNIYIMIEDDGKGMDKGAILAKAIERGLVREGESLSDREIFNLVLVPGFSMAKQVTEISGRGVGMDVVRRGIEGLRGQLSMSSEIGCGSSFTMRLPLTVAIIDGMIVRVGSERFIIPTLSIIRSIRPETENISTVFEKGKMLNVQDRLIPIFRLHDLFRVDKAEDALDDLVVIVEDNGRQVGLVTDELIGQQQIVIKSLGESMKDLQGISGGAIMADGRIGLIIDVGGLVDLAHSSESSATT